MKRRTKITCRVAESFRKNASFTPLRTNRPKVHFVGTIPGYTLPDLKEIFFDWVNRWSLVCNVEAVPAANKATADWIIQPAQIDGRGRILADMMLPGPKQQIMRIDTSENPSPEQLGLTFLHEAGHGYGLPHWDASPPPEVMEPTLNDLLTAPQPAESRVMAELFGPPIIATAAKSLILPAILLSSNGARLELREAR